MTETKDPTLITSYENFSLVTPLIMAYVYMATNLTRSKRTRYDQIENCTEDCCPLSIGVIEFYFAFDIPFSVFPRYTGFHSFTPKVNDRSADNPTIRNSTTLSSRRQHYLRNRWLIDLLRFISVIKILNTYGSLVKPYTIAGNKTAGPLFYH